MDVMDVSKLKAEVEQNIAEVLGDFEAKSKMLIETIDLRRIDGSGSIIDVALKVKL